MKLKLPQLGQKPSTEVTASMQNFCKATSQKEDEAAAQLPRIVELVESTPASAEEAARSLRKILEDKDTAVQYKGVMLLRILVDGAKAAFTKYIDSKLVAAVRSLLTYWGHNTDVSVTTLLMETLEHFSQDYSQDKNLAPLIELYKSQRERPQWARQQPSQNQEAPSSERIMQSVSEAKSTAQLLQQALNNTPATTMREDALLGDLCSRSNELLNTLQGYVSSHHQKLDPATLNGLLEGIDVLSGTLHDHTMALEGGKTATATTETPQQPELAPAAQMNQPVVQPSEHASAPQTSQPAVQRSEQTPA